MIEDVLEGLPATINNPAGGVLISWRLIVCKLTSRKGYIVGYFTFDEPHFGLRWLINFEDEKLEVALNSLEHWVKHIDDDAHSG